MKYSIFIGFLLMSLKLTSQSNGNAQTEIYFQFKAVKRSFSTGSFNITVDFGQKYFAKDSVEGEKIKSKAESFTEISDVLEYMNSMGWILVTAFTTSHDHFFTYYYIMKQDK